MGLVPNLKSKNQPKPSKFFSMLGLPYTKSGVNLFKTSFLGCLTRRGEPRLACIGRSGILDSGSHMHASC